MTAPARPAPRVVHPWRCTWRLPGPPPRPCPARGTTDTPSAAQAAALDHIHAAHDPEVHR